MFSFSSQWNEVFLQNLNGHVCSIDIKPSDDSPSATTKTQEAYGNRPFRVDTTFLGDTDVESVFSRDEWTKCPGGIQDPHTSMSLYWNI